MKKSKIIITALIVAIGLTPVFANDFGFGIELTKEDNGLIVQDVIPNSLVQKSGITKGLRITKINGKDANKINETDLKDLNNYSKLKLNTSNNKVYDIQKEDLSLLKTYNNISKFNNTTKYQLPDYITNNIIMKDIFNVSYIQNYTLFLNYADGVSLQNSKLFVNLFKITDENVKNALKIAQSTNNEYYDTYNAVFTNKRDYDVDSKPFKQFIELAIYQDVNKDLIKRQIKEFNDSEKQQLAQFVYNNKIIGNLYHQAAAGVAIYSFQYSYNKDKAARYDLQLRTQENMHLKLYKDFCKLLSENKIEYKKPDSYSNHAQSEPGVRPKKQSIQIEEMMVLAERFGYNPFNKPTVAKVQNSQKTEQKYNSSNAIDTYTKAINSAKNGSYEQSENYAFRAREYMLANNYNMAISDATKSIQIGFDTEKYDFVGWALHVYYTRGLSYFNIKNYSAAINDFNTYIQKANDIRKYMFDPQTELLLGNCYYLRVMAELEQYPLYRSKSDGKMVRYANMHNDMLKHFNDLETAIKIYSNLDLPQAQQKKAQASEYLKELKAAYYK